MTNKTYEFDNISQMLNVVSDGNIEVLCEDFVKFLILYNETIKQVREKHKELAEGKSNIEIMNAKFVWTDDGVSEIKGYEIKNTSSGEIEKVTINKK